MNAAVGASTSAAAGKSTQIEDSRRHQLLTSLAYGLVALAIVAGWRSADLNIIQAGHGLGYALGIIGTTLMALLLLYPARKRLRMFHGLGPVRHWFRVHMVFGILGPVLVLFHCNFQLGSINSRIALFSTLIVAASGIVGRYLYAKLHYGLYGHKASLVSLRQDLDQFRDGETAVAKLLPAIGRNLDEWEDGYLARGDGVIASLIVAASMGVASRVKHWRVRKLASQLVDRAASDSAIVAQHRETLLNNARRYISRRIMLMRKFAQYRSFERLFSLWHIVHYPLFLLLVFAVIVHVIAVHMY